MENGIVLAHNAMKSCPEDRDRVQSNPPIHVHVTESVATKILLGQQHTRAKSIFLIITMAMTMIVQQTFQFKLWPTGLHEHHRHQTHGIPQLVWALHTHTHTANQTTVLCTDQH